jgi:pimeloyl-ACP methyl ester carboxylesterase
MTNPSSGAIQSNGIRLHYQRTGGEKPPLVAAHGLTDNGLCWSAVAETLAAEYDVIMIDARGHGLSAAPESGYTPADHAADYAGAIRALSLPRPAMIGHSMGASTAAMVAAQEPGLLSCIILEDPPWRARELQRSGHERAVDADRWRQGVIDRQRMPRDQALAEGRQLHPKWQDAEFGPWLAAKFQVSPRTLDYVAAEPAPRFEFIPLIQCPALLLTGDTQEGAVVSAQLASEIGALNARIQVVHIPGAGHNIRREQFDAYVATVRRFLRAVYPP